MEEKDILTAKTESIANFLLSIDKLLKIVHRMLALRLTTKGKAQFCRAEDKSPCFKKKQNCASSHLLGRELQCPDRNHGNALFPGFCITEGLFRTERLDRISGRSTKCLHRHDGQRKR